MEFPMEKIGNLIPYHDWHLPLLVQPLSKTNPVEQSGLLQEGSNPVAAVAIGMPLLKAWEKSAGRRESDLACPSRALPESEPIGEPKGKHPQEAMQESGAA